MKLKTEYERWKKGLRALRLYRQCVKPGDLCFDIGANKGSRSMIFTALGARTIALEPNESLTQVLRRFPRVTVINKAVSDECGTKVFLLNANDQISTLSSEWKSKWPQYADWTEKRVECVTLDTLIAAYGVPDFCKIDVEGYEPAVLKGLSRPIPLLSFEATADFRSHTEECVARLAELGTYEFNFSLGDEFAFTRPAWVSAQQAVNLVDDAGDVYARWLP
jgi:FkbM family methyltransferase